MSKDDRFFEFLITFLQYVEEYTDAEVFWEFLEHNYDVKDIVQWYVEFHHAESTTEA